jgi:hypothetical protein
MKHLLTLLCLTTAPARADDLCPLVATLNTWVTRITDHQPPPCPQIGFTDLAGSTGVRSQAWSYDPASGRIELAPDLNLSTTYGQSYLLHELIHAAQFASGADQTALCPAALEAEAYGVQAAFLRQNDMGEEALSITILSIHLGACGMQTEY